MHSKTPHTKKTFISFSLDCEKVLVIKFAFVKTFSTSLSILFKINELEQNFVNCIENIDVSSFGKYFTTILKGTF